MGILAIMILNKAGGLIYQRDFNEGLKKLSSNDYLVLAGTFHGVHAITSRISPVPGSGGLEILESEHFRMQCFQTLTGMHTLLQPPPSQQKWEGMEYADMLDSSRHEIPDIRTTPSTKHRRDRETCLRAVRRLRHEEPLLPNRDADSLRSLRPESIGIYPAETVRYEVWSRIYIFPGTYTFFFQPASIPAAGASDFSSFSLSLPLHGTDTGVSG